MIGAVANNRFLQPVNKQIVRGLADAGANFVGNGHVLHPLYRQMVDLGISSNLKLWVHRDLVKTRTSGSDLYVPAAYDISSNDNDAVQATTANQPKLVSTGMEFDGSDDFMNCGVSSDFSFCDEDGDLPFTMMFWINVLDAQFNRILSKFNAPAGEREWYVDIISAGRLSFLLSQNTSINNRINCSMSTDETLFDEGWTMGVFTYTGSKDENDINLYINGSLKTNAVKSEVGTYPGMTEGGQRCLIGATSSTVSEQLTQANYFTGQLNDIRIFNKVLTATEISAIFNESKSYYGIT